MRARVRARACVRVCAHECVCTQPPHTSAPARTFEAEASIVPSWLKARCQTCGRERRGAALGHCGCGDLGRRGAAGLARSGGRSETHNTLKTLPISRFGPPWQRRHPKLQRSSTPHPHPKQLAPTPLSLVRGEHGRASAGQLVDACLIVREQRQARVGGVVEGAALDLRRRGSDRVRVEADTGMRRGRAHRTSATQRTREHASC